MEGIGYAMQTDGIQPVTGREAYADACRRLRDAGFTQEAAGREALELLAFCAGKDNLRLLLDMDAPMDPASAERFVEAVRRLAGDEPMAYITGSRIFGDMEYKVAPGVLIPREDTLVLVEQALARLAPDTEARLLELGSGSGAVIAAVASARPGARGVAVDIDPLAVELTRENLELHGLAERVQAVRGSWLEPVGGQGKFHMILSNPPYISTAEMAGLPESVKKEPAGALWGGEDGLDSYRQILPAAFEALADNGWCLVEIGWKQGATVKAMLEGAGFHDVDIYRDKGDRDRVAAGRKPAAADAAVASGTAASTGAMPMSAAGAAASASTVAATGTAGAAVAAAAAPYTGGSGKATQRWRVDDPGDPRIIEAGRVIREGGLVAFPTETVYGLGANGLDAGAVAGIYRAKGRPADNPLILHVASVAEAKELAASWSGAAQRLADKLWPGPLTLVLPAAAHIPPIVTAGLDTVAIRYPSDPVALALIEAAGVPVAAPSANASGRPSPTRAGHVMDDLAGSIDVVIDSGPCKVGLESTILDLTVEPPVILRPGDVTREALIRIIGEVRAEGPEPADHAIAESTEPADHAVAESTEPADGASAGSPGLADRAAAESQALAGEAFIESQAPDARAVASSPAAAPPKAPGMKYRHYAPKAKVVALQGEPHAVAAYITAELSRLSAEAGAGADAVAGADTEAVAVAGAEAEAGLPMARGLLKAGLLLSRETLALLPSGLAERLNDGELHYTRDMGSRDKPGEMAAILYDALRACDGEGVDIIYAEACSAEGQGAAVLNRLRKAAGGIVKSL